jgi:purine-binding chemotaxis protein CheW
VISTPAFAAANAVEYSAAFAASGAVENGSSVDLGRPSPEVEALETEQAYLYDPVEILLAGRAAAGFGQNSSRVSPDVAEVEVSDYQELLCFRVGTEQYAINIMEIKEIIKPREITEVPRVPDFISGVLSLRGIIIPVFNMGRRLHLAPIGHSVKERIIVVNRGEELFGILVDEVLQVVKVNQEAIEQPPAVLEGIDRDFVRGIGRHGGRMLILLNLESILDVSLC